MCGVSKGIHAYKGLAALLLITVRKQRETAAVSIAQIDCAKFAGCHSE
jgi:hypothetical protein